MKTQLLDLKIYKKHIKMIVYATHGYLCDTRCAAPYYTEV